MALSNLTKVQTLGIGSNIEVVGVITTGQFKSGTSNLHASGVELTNLNVSGIATIGGNVSIGGTLTYQDVTNIDSVGIITARSNIDCNGDLDVDGHTELDNVNIAGVTTFSEDAKFIGAISGRDLQWDKSDNALEFLDYTSAFFGTDNNLQIYHNAGNNNTYISENGTGSLLIQASDLYLNNSAGQNYIICATGGRVQLNFNGNNKLQTTNTGVVISGICTATSFSGDGSNLTGITQTTINSNADNRIITGSGTANTLNAEGNFLHDPTTCDTTIQHYEALKVVDLIIKNTNNHGNAAGARITIESGSAANTGPQFQMICGSHNWSMQVPKAAGNLEFNNNGTLDFLMADDGDFHIVDGDLVFSTAGHGIDFSATGDASGGTSELLDDYEEGSWTPYIYPMSSNIPVTYSHQSGRYQKIGNVVHFQFKLQVSNITGNRNQGFGISGFPYNNTGSQDYQTTGQFFGVTWDGEMPTTLVFTPNTTRGVCYYYADAMKYYSTSMLDMNVNSSYLVGSGFYFAA